MRDGDAIVRALDGHREGHAWVFRCPVCQPNPGDRCSAYLYDNGPWCFKCGESRPLAAALDALGFPDDGKSIKPDRKQITQIKAHKIAAAKAEWNDAPASPDDFKYVAGYLKTRGILVAVPPVMRRRRNGFLAALQSRTYEITAVHLKTPARESNTGAMTGSAVKLHGPCDGELGLAESVFDALSAYQLFGIPTWATCGSGLLHQVDLLVGLRLLHLFPDNDDAGRKAVERAKLAYRVRMKIHWPPPDFKDWNDALRGIKR